MLVKFPAVAKDQTHKLGERAIIELLSFPFILTDLSPAFLEYHSSC